MSTTQVPFRPLTIKYKGRTYKRLALGSVPKKGDVYGPCFKGEPIQPTLLWSPRFAVDGFTDGSLGGLFRPVPKKKAKPATKKKTSTRSRHAR